MHSGKPHVAAHVEQRSTRAVTTALLLTLLSGCSTVSSMFGSLFGASPPKPSPLQPFTPQRTLTAAWQQRLDGMQFPLVVAVTRGAGGAGRWTRRGG